MQLTLAAGFVPFSCLLNTGRVFKCGPGRAAAPSAQVGPGRVGGSGVWSDPRGWRWRYGGCRQLRWVQGWRWPRPGCWWPGGAGAWAVSALHRPAPAAPGSGLRALPGGLRALPGGSEHFPGDPSPAGASTSFPAVFFLRLFCSSEALLPCGLFCPRLNISLEVVDRPKGGLVSG